MKIRLIIHTDSLSQPDVNTFKAAALQLQKDYKAFYPSDNVKLGFVKSGKEIVTAINQFQVASYIPWILFLMAIREASTLPEDCRLLLNQGTFIDAPTSASEVGLTARRTNRKRNILRKACMAYIPIG